MEQAPNRRTDSFASLPDDLVLKILRRIPGPSLFRCKLVCRDWKLLINNSDVNDKLACQTVIGFFFDTGKKNTQHFTSFTDELLYFNFLHTHGDLDVSDCCNGLILCLSSGYSWIVCNPITWNYKYLPVSPHCRAQRLEGFLPLTGVAQLCFDPTVSSHFHVVEYVDGEDSTVEALQIYSSETNTWLSMGLGWRDGIDIQLGETRSVFLNSFLYNMAYVRAEGTSAILAVDMEGNTLMRLVVPIFTS